ncbi:MAG: hypothetical protein WDN28_05665 [Chthoniobacter sp.]
MRRAVGVVDRGSDEEGAQSFWFLVSGFWFLRATPGGTAEFWSGQWRSLEELDEARENAAHAETLLLKVREYDFVDVTLVERNVKLGANFTSGTFRNGQRLHEFTIPSALKSLGNVRSDGNGRPANLISQREIACEFPGLRHAIDRAGQLAAELPSFNVFELGNCHGFESC